MEIGSAKSQIYRAWLHNFELNSALIFTVLIDRIEIQIL